MVHVSDDLEDYVQQKIASGQFASQDEFVNEAIRVFREIEAQHQQLRTDVQRSIEEADRGEVEPMDIGALKAKLLAELDRHRRPKSCRE